MRKRIVALICVLGLVPSMGVLAAGPEGTEDYGAAAEQTTAEQQTTKEVTMPEQQAAGAAKEVTVPEQQAAGEAGEQAAAEETAQQEAAGSGTEENAEEEEKTGLPDEDTTAEEEKETANENTGVQQGSQVLEPKEDARTVPHEDMDTQAAVYSDAVVKNEEPSVTFLYSNGYKITLQDGQSYYGDDVEGTITWHKDSSTIEFNNFKLTYDGGSVKIAVIGDITLVLAGDTLIKASHGNVTISCEGGDMCIESKDADGVIRPTLQINSEESTIEVKDGSLELEGADIGVYSSSTEGLEKWADDHDYSNGIQGVHTGDFTNGPNEGADDKHGIYITDGNIAAENSPIMSSGDIVIKGNSTIVCNTSKMNRVPGLFAKGKIVFDRVTGRVEYYGDQGILARKGIDFINTSINGMAYIVHFKGGTGIIKDGYMMRGGNGKLELGPAGSAPGQTPNTIPDTTPSGEGKVQKLSSASTAASTGNGTVKTGDQTRAATWMILLTAAACCAAAAAKYKRQYL